MKKTMKKPLSLTLSAVITASLSGPIFAYGGTTETGLDQIVSIINSDVRLNRKVTEENIELAAIAADRMNEIIKTAIVETGVANDEYISTADTRELNDYIFAHHYDEWLVHHGDDEDGVETGFHLVQNNGARTRLYGKNAINKVADSIYHLGFESDRRHRLTNEDGAANARYAKVGTWLSNLLVDDLANGTLANPAIVEVEGSTGTGLDSIIDIIYNDWGLNKRISTGDMRNGAAAADAMNHIIVEAIKETGTAADGSISKEDVRTISQYIQDNHYTAWLIHHGDDEAGEETGFHLVQSDGAKTRLFNKNAINKIADSIYHLGFGTNANGRRLINEDGNNNAGVKRVAQWLNQLLAADLAAGTLLKETAEPDSNAAGSQPLL